MRKRAVVAMVGIGVIGLAAFAAADGDDPGRLTLPQPGWRLNSFVAATLAVMGGLTLVTFSLARRRGRSPRARSGPTAVIPPVVAVIIVMFAVGLVLRDLPLGEIIVLPGAGGVGEEGRNDVVHTVATRDVGMVLVTLCLIGASVVAAAGLRSRRVDSGSSALVMGGSLRLEGAIRDGREVLSGPTAGLDPRQTVLECWRVLEGALTAAGVPRSVDETAQEYLERGLAPLAPPVEALTELVRLVEEARWSLHPVTGAHVASARSALDAVLNATRAAP